MESALTGLKIVDLSRFAPGPYCTMILSDLGADVIKVEENVPTLSLEQIDQLKKAGKIPNASEFASPDSPCNPLNRNKRSIKINLKADSGKNILYKLAAKADVVIEGFRPGVAKRLKIDFDTLKAINPRIIYCSITGYGQDGPYALLPGHDINYAAAGGAIGTVSFSNSMPITPGNFLGDMAGGGLQAVTWSCGAWCPGQSSWQGCGAARHSWARPSDSRQPGSTWRGTAQASSDNASSGGASTS